MMKNNKTAFVTFFPVSPDNMGSSAVINSRFNVWPSNKKIFQISHINKKKNKYFETVYIRKESPINKIASLPKLIFKVFKYLKNSKSKTLIIEGASWIFYSFLVLFAFKIILPSTKIIYISHSVEFEIRKKYSNLIIYSLTYFLEYLVFKNANTSTTVSKIEWRKIYRLYKIKTIIYPNGITIKEKKGKKLIKNKYIIYCGSYFYKPNKKAIDYLNNFLMPNLCKKFPKIKLVLTGGGYTKKYPWLINKNIVSKDKLYNLISFSSCMLVPLEFGSGTRIKIIESLMLGCIVLSSVKGIEGKNLKKKNPPFIASSMNNQIKKLTYILNNNKKLKKFSNNNINYYNNLYSMNNITKKFLKILAK